MCSGFVHLQLPKDKNERKYIANKQASNKRAISRDTSQSIRSTEHASLLLALNRRIFSEMCLTALKTRKGKTRRRSLDGQLETYYCSRKD